MKHFLSIRDYSESDIRDLLDLATSIKKALKSGKVADTLNGKTLGMIFQKPSTRTRLSFEVGMNQLGGSAIYIPDTDIGLGTREPIHDVSRVMSRYVDGVLFRTKRHSDLLSFANHSSVPVINGLSDLNHPCQALADALTIKEEFGQTDGVKLTYIGDGNNVCVSLMEIALRLGIKMTVCSPDGYLPSKSGYDGISFTHSVKEAIDGADVIYTDVWTSMGQELEAKERLNAFRDYQITLRTLESVSQDVRLMHCLPAHRGEEVSDNAIESSHSIVFDQAENRLHAQKAILVKLMS